MTNQELDDIFQKTAYWKGHKITWCDHCTVYTISCEYCRNSTCNGGGCDKCTDLFREFNQCKISPYDYLNEEERKVYYKVLRLMDFIPMSLNMGDKEIDWQKMEKTGQCCTKDWEVFEFEKKGIIDNWK